jgi:hypothetical protein
LAQVSAPAAGTVCVDIVSSLDQGLCHGQCQTRLRNTHVTLVCWHRKAGVSWAVSGSNLRTFELRTYCSTAWRVSAEEVATVLLQVGEIREKPGEKNWSGKSGKVREFKNLVWENVLFHVKVSFCRLSLPTPSARVDRRSGKS